MWKPYLEKVTSPLLILSSSKSEKVWTSKRNVLGIQRQDPHQCERFPACGSRSAGPHAPRPRQCAALFTSIGNLIVDINRSHDRLMFTMRYPILVRGCSWGCLNIKMSSYQYRDPHVKDKMVSRPSYFWHGNPHTWKRRSLYWDGALLPLET